MKKVIRNMLDMIRARDEFIFAQKQIDLTPRPDKSGVEAAGPKGASETPKPEQYVANNATYDRAAHRQGYDNEKATEVYESRNPVNHMGEPTYNTYKGWKKAMKKIHPDARFEGDKDIAHAFHPAGHGIGEWDGEVGTKYSNVKEEILEELNNLWEVFAGTFAPEKKQRIAKKGEHTLPNLVRVAKMHGYSQVHPRAGADKYFFQSADKKHMLRVSKEGYMHRSLDPDAGEPATGFSAKKLNRHLEGLKEENLQEREVKLNYTCNHCGENIKTAASGRAMQYHLGDRHPEQTSGPDESHFTPNEEANKKDAKKRLVAKSRRNMVDDAMRSIGLTKVRGPVSGKIYWEQVEELDERELSADELADRERLVMHMKKNKADFKSRYGDRWKSVMYATATKMAKEHTELTNENVLKESELINEIHVKGPIAKGKLHKKLHIKAGKKVGKARLEKAAHSKSKAERKEAQFALNMHKREFAKEEVINEAGFKLKKHVPGAVRMDCPTCGGKSDHVSAAKWEAVLGPIERSIGEKPPKNEHICIGCGRSVGLKEDISLLSQLKMVATNDAPVEIYFTDGSKELVESLEAQAIVNVFEELDGDARFELAELFLAGTQEAYGKVVEKLAETSKGNK